MLQLLSSELSGDAVGRKVRIYRNLSPRYKARGQVVWSVMDDESGLVLGHATHVGLADATFRVSEAGRQRVLRTGRKAVHAVVVGTLESFKRPHREPGHPLGELSVGRTFTMPEAEARLALIDTHAANGVRYNPFKVDTFVVDLKGGDQPIFEAPLVEAGYCGVEAWLPC